MRCAADDDLCSCKLEMMYSCECDSNEYLQYAKIRFQASSFDKQKSIIFYPQ